MDKVQNPGYPKYCVALNAMEDATTIYRQAEYGVLDVHTSPLERSAL
jgi:hypothetical protein